MPEVIFRPKKMVKQADDDRPGFADHVVRSTLQLKGGLNLKKNKRKKPKKHKKKHKERHGEQSADSRVKEALDTDSSNSGTGLGSGSYGRDGVSGDYKRHLTPAQLRHAQMQEQRAALEAEQAAAVTHREKVARFNEKLASLTEHHDIPRVSAAGNG